MINKIKDKITILKTDNNKKITNLKTAKKVGDSDILFTKLVITKIKFEGLYLFH